MSDDLSRRDALRAAGAAGLALTVGRPAPAGEKPVVPLPRTHAHNDYEHPRPLLDALAHGFCSVESDIYLADGKLLVAHERKDLKPDRTLEKLYLDPLRERVKANGGKVYPGGPAFHLLIDVKTGAAETYAALDRVLARYADVLSVVRGGKFEPKAVTAVVSGNRDKEAMTRQAVRFAGIDGRPEDLGSLGQRQLGAAVPLAQGRADARRGTTEVAWDGREGSRAGTTTPVLGDAGK